MDEFYTEVDEWDSMFKKLKGMSDEQICSVWNALKHYDPKEFYAPGISMDDWAQQVYSEMDIRGLPHI